MFIDLPSFYQNTNGVQIPAGVYEDTDERLRGLADYLVRTGHAKVVTTVKAGLAKAQAAVSAAAQQIVGADEPEAKTEPADEDEPEAQPAPKSGKSGKSAK